MKIKKAVLLLIFILMAQIGCGFSRVIAQDSGERQQIENLLKNFLQDFYHNNYNAVISKISTLYHQSGTMQGSGNDYAEFKSHVKNAMDSLSKKYIDISVANLEILKLDKQSEGIAVTIEYSWKGFKLEAGQNEIASLLSYFLLAKEDGSWKIINWPRPITK
jgi:hypothetical protein